MHELVIIETVLSQRFSNWVPQRDVLGSERQKCIMVKSFIGSPKFLFMN